METPTEEEVQQQIEILEPPVKAGISKAREAEAEPDKKNFWVSEDGEVERVLLDDYQTLFEKIELSEEELNYVREYANSNAFNFESLARDVDWSHFYERYGDKLEADRMCAALDVVFEYAGSLAFSKGELEYERETLKTIVERRLSTLQKRKENKTIVCPLLNFDCEPDTIQLDPGFQFNDTPGYVTLDGVEIRRPTASEVAAIYNAEDGEELSSVLRHHSYGITHILSIEITGRTGGIEPRQVVQSVCRALRAFNPEKPLVYGGSAYYFEEGPLTDRLGVMDLAGHSPPELTPETKYTSDSFYMDKGSRTEYTLKEDEVNRFQEFWKNYKNYLNGEADTKIRNTLRRHDEMYSDLYLEDKIVDCAIGFEGTLLKDIGTQSSFSFRLGIRSVSLLQDRVEYGQDAIRQFFKNLYFTRGEIVHKDIMLEEIVERPQFKPISGKSYAPEEFTKLSRKFLTEVILAYIEEEKEGNSITEVNQTIDSTILDRISDRG